MAFNWFKKRNDVIDLRKRGDSITIATSESAPASQAASPSDVPAPSAPVQSQGSGFFNFWGNSESSSSQVSSTSSSPSSDFTSSSSIDSDKTLRIERRIDDIADRLSRILDRVDLLEKKMDRVDRRGI